MTICAAEGCMARGDHRGACPKHYQRFKKYGTYDLPLRLVQTPEERFWSKIDKTETCWLWTAGLSDTGYAQFLPEGRNGRRVLAHRYAYELLVGPILPGLHLDHLCRVRNCVRPSHLEPVTQRENTLRGDSPNAIAARENRCHRGHAFTPENTYVRPDNGGRQCRACRKERKARRLREAMNGETF